MINKSDLLVLEKKYEKALEALSSIRYEGGYPVYPNQVSEFMGALVSPPWGLGNYKPEAVGEIMECIEKADLEDIRCVLTKASRSERFCDGSWANTLENKVLDPVFQRLRQIVNA